MDAAAVVVTEKTSPASDRVGVSRNLHETAPMRPDRVGISRNLHETVPMRPDRVGIGWRGPLAGGILRNLDAIDVIEVVAESRLQASRQHLNALQAIAAQVPILVHGLDLGMASCSPVAERKLGTLARFIHRLQPESWSEHLAFVRAGGREIGHLAQPPRTAANIDGTVRNLRRASTCVGAAPLLENIASLIEPPGSTLGPLAWMHAILNATPCDILLDLHNLHANAHNFGFDPEAFICALPPARIGAVHLAGGRLLAPEPGCAAMLLDDHCHPVPQAVFDLLTTTAAHACKPLTVIIERDGGFPPFDALLSEMRQAREALRRGRAQAARGEAP